jgi:hypothetical protein
MEQMDKREKDNGQQMEEVLTKLADTVAQMDAKGVQELLLVAQGMQIGRKRYASQDQYEHHKNTCFLPHKDIQFLQA